MKVVAIKISSKMTKATATTTTTTKIKTTVKAATEAMAEKGVVVMIEGIAIMIEVVVVAEMIEEEDVEAVVMIEVVADLPIVKLLID